MLLAHTARKIDTLISLGMIVVILAASTLLALTVSCLAFLILAFKI
jgi:hypothetical protein